MNRKLAAFIPVLAIALAAVWLAKAAATPAVTFEIDPPNPVAGQAVVLRDTSAAASSSWLWNFGDGQSATNAAPSHTWAVPGTYTVGLTAQGTTTEQSITVTPSTTMRLLAVHPFDVSISATDPNSGVDSPGLAVAVTDRFGWFSLPGITNDPGNPEVTVKLLEAPTFGHYWVFWSAMTSLKYKMTVTDVTTGQVQVYEKTDSAPSGGWDLQSFPYATTPTPGPPTETPVPGQPTRTRTPTRSATSTPTPTGSPAPPTPTPTPSGPATLTLRVVSYTWTWCPQELPCTPGNCAATPSAETLDSPSGVVHCDSCGMTLHSNCNYNLIVFNGDGPDANSPYHTLDPHPDIGLANPIQVFQGQPVGPVPITIPTISTPTDDPFSCTNTSCGDPSHHESMIGVIHLLP